MTDAPTVNPTVTAVATRSASTPAALPPSKLSEKHEHFCLELMEHGNVGDAYAAAYPRCGSRAAAWAHGCRLRARQDVQERLRELKALAAERALIKPAMLLYELYELATADPAELSRVVIDPCPTCWPDDVLGVAADRWLAGDGELPDSSVPQADCRACRGRGISRVVHTPTAELRGAARRLFAGAKTKSDGSVEVMVVDQLAARRELHALLGLHVNRSINANITVPVKPLPDNLSVADALRMLESIAPARPDDAAPIPNDPAVVSEQ